MTLLMPKKSAFADSRRQCSNQSEGTDSLAIVVLCRNILTNAIINYLILYFGTGRKHVPVDGQ